MNLQATEEAGGVATTYCETVVAEATARCYCPFSQATGDKAGRCIPLCIFHEVRLAGEGGRRFASDEPFPGDHDRAVFCKLAGEFVGRAIQSENGGEDDGRQ